MTYRDSLAYQRSNRLRPDGKPVWPLTAADLPSLPQAHANVARRQQLREDLKAVRASGRVG